MPLEVGAWGIDAAYSCTQKCLGGPAGLAPVVFGPRALEQRVKCRSFYFDLSLLEDYWLRRKYHHTMCHTLIYSLDEALAMVEEEGLEARWARHERHHQALAAGLEAMGLSLLPAASERLWTLNTVRVPGGRPTRPPCGSHCSTTVQHRDRRRARSAGREDLARRPDGCRLDAADAAAVPGGIRRCARSRREAIRQGAQGVCGAVAALRRGPDSNDREAVRVLAALAAVGFALSRVRLPHAPGRPVATHGHRIRR